MEKLVSLVPMFPLIGFLYITFFGKGLSKNFVGWVASGSILLSFFVSVVVFSTQLHGGHSAVVNICEWIGAGELQVNISFIVDPLSTIYLLFVTGVGFLIHAYSIGYMHDDEGFSRFMSYLNLFVFFMLLLVLGDSYLLMFVGWEGVGLCSFMLIGFWYKDMKNNDAAKKAFIMNRVGDLGFIIGMCLLFYYTGTLNYNELYEGAKISALDTSEATTVAILFFIGAMGKSAQFPLHTWLPDAMAGPTPVSALIHAATMVTAGIYLLARSSDLFAASEVASAVVTWIGIFTAILGATIALAQNDIKKVLAYSTVSQLGLMFVALGLGAYSIAVFHVITHAFFKALLFLGSGSVIHAMGGEQDIRRMGGLKKYLPTTHWTFLVGCLAISGIVPFAGFFSKDQIIATAWEMNPVVFILSIGVSALTAFYMFRLYFLTFHGEFRGTHAQEHHVHESPKVMTLPLIVLAVLSIVGGFIGFPHAAGHALNIPHWLDHFLEPTSSSIVADMHITIGLEAIMMVVATLVAVVSIWYAYTIYYKRRMLALEDDEIDSSLHHALVNKYWLDELYDAIIRKPVDKISAWFARIVEPKLIDGTVNGSGKLTQWAGQNLKLLHNGKLGVYILVMIIGLLVMLLTLL
ncbi:MAG: NADH-quinone oxidoreductase subunit L [Flavobacteriales bacterium]|nr:NADH-quinone oxidoreductase subunit L [Flavobacteriales bacterium]